MKTMTEIKTAYQIAAAKGSIPEEHVNLLTLGTIAEVATVAFNKAYFGDKVWRQAQDDVRNTGDAAGALTESVIHAYERKAPDVMNLKHLSARESIIATTDLPSVLGRARDIAIRDTLAPEAESPLLAAATRRTATSFHTLRGVRYDGTTRLFEQPEATNVRYEPLEMTEDGYQISVWSRALGFTFQAATNDDVGYFAAQTAGFGRAARQNRIFVLLEAIFNEVARTTPTGTMPSGGTASAGGPTIANLEYVAQLLATRDSPEGESLGQALTRIAIPANWIGTANMTVNRQEVSANVPNPVYQTFGVDVERAMPRIAAAAPNGNALDWLAFDDSGSWLEFATLAGYEGGPQFFNKLPDVQETNVYGSFDNLTLAFKVQDILGAKVTNPDAVVRVAGA